MVGITNATCAEYERLGMSSTSGAFFIFFLSSPPCVEESLTLCKIQDGFTKGTRSRAGLHWNEIRNIWRYFVEPSARKGLEKNSQIPPKFAQISRRGGTHKLNALWYTSKLLINELELDIII